MSTEVTVSDSMGNSKNTSQFVGFRLLDQEYVFPIGQIQEIVILDRVTRMPQVADYVEGVSNLRGTIIPVINLRLLFGLESRPADDETRTIVVNVGTRTMGCTVDAVTQVIRIPVDDIQPAPDIIAGEGTPWIDGFAKIDDRLLIVLDINELLDPAKLDQVRDAVKSAGMTSTSVPQAD